MLEVWLGIVTFTATVLSLTLVVLLFRGWLVPTGTAHITINGTQRFEHL